LSGKRLRPKTRNVVKMAKNWLRCLLGDFRKLYKVPDY
jgi:hypothetical protein